MRKSLGSKRNYLTENEIATITQNYGAFVAVDTLANDGETEQQNHSPARFLITMNLAIVA